MIGMIGVDECRAAQAVLRRFIQALRRDDLEEAGALIYGPSADLWGVPRGAAAAQSFHDQWAIPDATLRWLDPTNTARVIEDPNDPDALVAFGMVIVTHDELARPVTLIDGARPAYVVALIEGPNGWVIWGTIGEAEWRAARHVDIPPG